MTSFACIAVVILSIGAFSHTAEKALAQSPPISTMSSPPADLEQARIAYYHDNYVVALATFQTLAAKENPIAKRFLAYMYLGGDGVKQDSVKAAGLLRAASEQGDLLSLFSLGGLYAQGLGVEKNPQEAVRLYTRAAEGGLANAQLNLGSHYRFGHGVPQNLPEAVKWFRAAAEQGHARAQTILGVCYAEGLGVARNESEAVRWLRRAADKDYVQAQYFLALKYMQGVGVSKDFHEMSRWLKRASEWGDAYAQYNFGVALATGQGLPQDLVQAHVWFSLAESQHHPSARAALEQLAKMMIPTQLLEARKRREQWKPLTRVWSEGMSDWEWISLADGHGGFPPENSNQPAQR